MFYRYDRKDLSFRHLQDIQFIAAMGPPGGGRNSVTNRYLRHFSVISVTAFDNETLSTIFSALVDWWMKKAGFSPNVTKLAKPLVAASLEVYETIQKQLLPTPTKSHYTFNLRDVSKVIQVTRHHQTCLPTARCKLHHWLSILDVHICFLLCMQSRLLNISGHSNSNAIAAWEVANTLGSSSGDM